MKALISTIEPVQSGYRVAQVEQDESIFAVAEGLFWVDCADNVLADQYWFDPQDQTLKAVPATPLPDPVVAGNQPTVQGAQTL